MSKLDTSYLGSITLRLFRDLPTDTAGWLVHALAVWISDGKQPDEADIPPECLGAWIAIREESITIHELRKARSDAGRVAGLASANENRRTATNGNELQRTPTNGNVARARIDEDEDNISSVNRRSSKEPLPRPSPSVDTSSIFSDDVLKRDHFDVWARRCRDPVTVALEVAGEGSDKRRVFGSLLRSIGKERFIETCCTFRAEIAAGEEVGNRGAALVARLKEAVEAFEAAKALAQ